MDGIMSPTNDTMFKIDYCSLEELPKEITTSYNFIDIPFIENNGYIKYLLCGSNQEAATVDVLSLNTIFDLAQKYIPNKQIFNQLTDNDLEFSSELHTDIDMFCYLKESVYTPSGKVSKYPFMLHFAKKGNVFLPALSDTINLSGNIYYLQDGTIGKADIWSTGKNSFFTLHCKKVDGVLTLITVESPCYLSYSNFIFYKHGVSVFPPEDGYIQRVVKTTKEEKVYHKLSDLQVEKIKQEIENAYQSFNIKSKVLECRINDECTEIDISVPDGVRLNKLLSLEDDIDLRVPDITLDMHPDFNRSVIVIVINHKSDTVTVETEEVVNIMISPEKKESSEKQFTDDKYEQAVQIVIDAQMASTTLLQRKLNIGYARAALLIDELEEQKIVGPFDGSKPRKVLITKPQCEDKYYDATSYTEDVKKRDPVPPKVGFWQRIRKHFKSKKTASYELSRVDNMRNGYDFEQYTAKLLKRNGYSRVRVTQASGDYGIDVIAHKDGISYAIQCKRYSSKLGNSCVQEAFAGKSFYGCDYAVVITNSTFTDNAIRLANSTGVILWDRADLFKLIKNTL